MFETVAPETFELRSRKALYESLPISIALHAVAIGAAFVIAIWNVVFPVQSPKLVRAYSLVSIPEPPPPPPLIKATPQPKHVELPKVPPPQIAQIVAPTVIPDTIPQLPEPAPLVLPPEPAPAPVGIPGGSVDGKLGGDMGGKLHGVAGGVAFPDDGRVHVERNEQLPLVVVSQDYPSYPEEGRKKMLEDQVIVRYVIGKNGRVIDVQIIDHARDPIFDAAAVEAIKRWRFRPMIKDGKAVEVVHELAVNFELIRH